MGAFALLLSGGILASMIQLYFDGEMTGEALVTSRWWWEIVMNLQVASIAFMWFCYVERIGDAEGARKDVLRFRLVCNIGILLLPVWIAILAAQMNWFVERPSLKVFDYLTYIMLGSWMFVVLMSRFLLLRRHPDAYGGDGVLGVFKPKDYYSWIPGIIALAIWLFEQFNGGTLHYRLVPLLLYVQGAIPFIRKGLAFGEREEAK